MKESRLIFLIVLLVGLVAVSSALAQGCPPGTRKTGEERTETADAIYISPRCQQLTALESRSLQAIDRAATGPYCHSGECNLFVGDIARIRRIPYFKDILSDQSPDGRMASEIYGFVKKAVLNSASSGWREVSPNEAQRLANEGRFVIGVARHRDPSPTNHGHIVVAVPDHLTRDESKSGSGPWIRDSKNAGLSIKSNWSFSRTTLVGPIWAVYIYDDPQ